MGELEAVIEARVTGYQRDPHPDLRSLRSVGVELPRHVLLLVPLPYVVTGGIVAGCMVLAKAHPLLGISCLFAAGSLIALSLWWAADDPDAVGQLPRIVLAQGGIADIRHDFPPSLGGRRVRRRRIARKLGYLVRGPYVLHPELGPAAVREAKRRLLASGVPLAHLVAASAAEALALEELTADGVSLGSPYRSRC